MQSSLVMGPSELGFTSRVRPDLVVMGSKDAEALAQTRQ